jgi:hypothetical protein
METNKLESVQTKLESVKITMNENIQFALKNTDKIDDIQQKSETLMSSSQTFSERATILKRNMCSKYWKQNITILITVLIIIIIIIIALN